MNGSWMLCCSRCPGEATRADRTETGHEVHANHGESQADGRRLPDDYLPFRDDRQTVWEGCQHLIKRLQDESEEAAARLAKQLGYQADMARDLAYRLYQICERKGWAEEARAYNGLVESWREIIKIRDTLPDETAPGPAQAELAI
jgi:putative DNA methylase